MLFPQGYQIETNLSKWTAQFPQTIFNEISFSLNLIFKEQFDWAFLLCKIKPLKL